MQARVIALANQKGGVGKTTTAVNLAACLAAAEKKTLLIDLDHQGNATSGLGINKNAHARTVYDVLVDDCALKDVMIPTVFDFLQLVPANRDLVGAQLELANSKGGRSKLRKAIEPLRPEYEFIFIDCPPSLGLLTINGLVAADSVLVPLQCEYYALEGLADLVATVEEVRATLNANLRFEGIVLTMYDSRTKLSEQVAVEARDHFHDRERVYATVIPRNVALAEAPSFGKPIILYDIKSKGAVSYMNLAKEVIANGN